MEKQESKKENRIQEMTPLPQQFEEFMEEELKKDREKLKAKIHD